MAKVEVKFPTEKRVVERNVRVPQITVTLTGAEALVVQCVLRSVDDDTPCGRLAYNVGEMIDNAIPGWWGGEEVCKEHISNIRESEITDEEVREAFDLEDED